MHRGHRRKPGRHDQFLVPCRFVYKASHNNIRPAAKSLLAVMLGFPVSIVFRGPRAGAFVRSCVRLQPVKTRAAPAPDQRSRRTEPRLRDVYARGQYRRDDCESLSYSQLSDLDNTV
jgi:hypothetical protein